jgi:hypothetical protein
MKWYEIHDNFVLLYRYLKAQGFDADQLEPVVSEPWHWEKEFNDARRWAKAA